MKEGTVYLSASFIVDGHEYNGTLELNPELCSRTSSEELTTEELILRQYGSQLVSSMLKTYREIREKSCAAKIADSK